MIETLKDLNFDFTHAFHLVNFDLLIRKLKAYEIGGQLLSWFQSYLIGRV